MLNEFKAFLTKTNALALAIGVIIGAASTKVVSAIVADVFMPLLGIVLPAGGWREAKWVLSTGKDANGKVTENAILYGDLMGNIIDFIIISFVVFMVSKWLLKPEPAAATQTCPFCMETIPAEATKCRACASTVGGAAPA